MTSTRRVALGAFGALFATPFLAADMTAAEKANVRVVKDFCASWATQDLDKIMSFFAENCAYRVTETAEPVKGREAIRARITPMVPTVNEGLRIIDTWARGPMVVHERMDRTISGGMKSWHGVGVFFLKDGKIAEWYDYTIAMERR